MKTFVELSLFLYNSRKGTIREGLLERFNALLSNQLSQEHLLRLSVL
jgi:hypothetical protein